MLESSLKKPIRDDHSLLISICGGIEAVFRQGLKSKTKNLSCIIIIMALNASGFVVCK